MSHTPVAPEPVDFVRERVARDQRDGTYDGRVQTRFPPEPNGFLHIGHAKAIYADFAIAAEFGGVCNLRFDDTNPDTEETRFVDSIIEDIRWLGFEIPEPVLYASDYFKALYDWAVLLIRDGKAYVDDQDAETISAQRGGYGKPGVESPYRDRPVEESLDLFARMRAGEFAEGERCLRAKIDMQDDNMWLRDPVMYRIRKAPHHRTGETWAIYPSYDWAHGQSDALEGVTHSFCTPEFDVHRPLYDWFLENLPLPHEKPQQIEFARLELTHIVTSKRKLRQLVADGLVDGWDDPRMPTLRGMKRLGYPSRAIREFCAAIGLSRTNARHDLELLESHVRRVLNETTQRRMAVVNPVKLVLTDWPVDADGRPVVEEFEIINSPEDGSAGSRMVPFTGELWIEADDFALEPPPKFFRLAPGREVRLRGAYLVTCTDAVTDETGAVVEIHASYDPASRGGNAPDGRKVKSTMHWVSAPHAVDLDVAEYGRLFAAEVPGEGTGDAMDDLNLDNRVMRHAKGEPSLAEVSAGDVVQFERLGYYCADLDRPGLFHRTVGLKDEWANLQKRR